MAAVVSLSVCIQICDTALVAEGIVCILRKDYKKSIYIFFRSACFV